MDHDAWDHDGWDHDGWDHDGWDHDGWDHDGLVTAREAARILEAVGVGRRRSRQLLESGFAGPKAGQAGRAHLYQRRRVEDLAAWPQLTLEGLDDLFPAGAFISRRYVSSASVAAGDEQLRTEQLRAELARDWPLSVYTAVWIRHQIRKAGWFPFVATVCGFVVHAAEIVAVHSDSDLCHHLQLRDAGAWHDLVHQHRLSTPAGAPWTVRGWPLPVRRVS